MTVQEYNQIKDALSQARLEVSHETFCKLLEAEELIDAAIYQPEFGA